MSPSASSRPGIAWLCSLLWAGSYLLPFHPFPLVMLPAMLLAVLTWGLAATVPATWQGPTPGQAWRWGMPLAALLVPALAGWRWQADGLLVMTAAAAVMTLGAADRDSRWWPPLARGLLIAGLVSVALGLVQVFAPAWEAWFISPVAQPGRAGANLRQPNLLSTLMLLAFAALVGLRLSDTAATKRRLHGALAVAAAVALGLGVALTQSRMGLLGVGLAVVWALLDRAMPGPVRRLAGWLALGALAGTGLMTAWAQAQGGSSWLSQRMAAGTDLSGSRLSIWRDTLALIAQHPWTGVGWGEFGRAWMLTPSPQRSYAIFQNAHNLPLQLWVELGVPLGSAVMAAVLVPLAAAWRGGRHDDTAVRLSRRPWWLMLGWMGLHSLLEYPLWYPFFLLPTAYVLGRLLVGGDARAVVIAPGGTPAPDATAVLPSAASARAPAAGTTPLGHVIAAAGVLMVLGSLYAAWDYTRVQQVFRPFGPGLRQSLEVRIDAGRRSVLFGHWVDYGLVTNAETWRGLEPALSRALHRNPNPHLLQVWAQALHERGDEERARFLLDRVREFRHPGTAEFLAACESPDPRPFPCPPSTRSFPIHDFD